MTEGSFNMYAYGRDNPTGGTCTGDSYNFSNSANTRLTVNTTPTVTTVAPTVVGLSTLPPLTSTTTTPTVVSSSDGQVGIESWSMVASPNPVRPGQQFVLTTTISCGRQMSASASPYYPSMYYMVSSSPRLNGVYSGTSLSGDRRTATFSVTLNAPVTEGSFNMYAYGRDNPTGGTCTGDSYNFSNSATTRLTVNATPTVTTVAPTIVGLSTLAPLTSTTLVSQVIYTVQSERPVSISPDVFKVTIPSGAIQNLFDSVSPEDVNSSLVKIRTNDGKWKTVRSTSIFDANIELTPRSQRIEIQLIVEGKDPITYEIVLDRVASSSSKSPNFAMSIALGFCILLIAMYFLIFKRRRHDEK